MMGIGGSTAAIELANLNRWPAPAALIKREEHLRRIERAQRLMPESGADAVLVGAGASLRYFTGVAWGATERLVAAMIPSPAARSSFVLAFEYDSLRASIAIEAKIHLWEEDQNPFRLVKQLLAERGIETLALDPALLFSVFDGIRNQAPMRSLVSGTAIIDGCRMINPIPNWH